MKNLMKFSFMAVMMAGLLFMTSCGDDNEDIFINTGDGLDAKLNINYSDSLSATVDTDVIDDGQVNVRVTIESDENVRRVYITQNIFGQGEEAIDAKALFGSNIDTKGDGSIDVENSFNGSQIYFFNIALANLPAASGTIVYRFWATKNKGDFRDDSKDRVESVATLTVELGDGQNPSAAVKSYAAKLLAAPAADGSSSTFISLTDGSIFRIDQGEEYAAFWDFGYYYGASGVSAGQEASLASTSAYEESFGFVDVDAVAGTTDLNSAYFALSSMTSDQFDAITTSGELNSITQSSSQKINNLAVGDIIEFVDNYGKKGLIKVTAIVPGFNPTDSITIEIKVQP